MDLKTKRKRLGAAAAACAAVAAALVGAHLYWVDAIRKAIAGGNWAAALAGDLLYYIDGACALAALAAVGLWIARRRLPE